MCVTISQVWFVLIIQLFCEAFFSYKSLAPSRSASTISDVVPRAGLSNVLELLGIEAGGVRELTVLVLGLEAITHGGGDAQEVLEVLAVGVVHVEVVLEVLEHVHVLLDELVASNSGEGEGLVVELPGVHVHLGILALLSELGLDVLGVGPVSLVEGSGEHVDLVVELLLGLIEVDAGSVELNEIDDRIIVAVDGSLVGLHGLKGGDGGLGGLDLGGDAEKSGKNNVFHYKRKGKILSSTEVSFWRSGQKNCCKSMELNLLFINYYIILTEYAQRGTAGKLN